MTITPTTRPVPAQDHRSARLPARGPRRPRPLAAAVTALAFLLLFRYRWSVLRTLGACTIAGVLVYPVTL